MGASRVALVALFATLACLSSDAAPARLADVDIDADAGSANLSAGDTPLTESLVQGLIQAGFPRTRAEAALRAVGEKDCCEAQKRWLFEQNRGGGDGDVVSGGGEGNKTLSDECHVKPHTDYDGYAVMWGSANIQPSPEACCQSCHDYTPKAPDFYPCNVWVYCPEKEGCFAPAAGDFIHGQCWLKYQEDPTHPHGKSLTCMLTICMFSQRIAFTMWITHVSATDLTLTPSPHSQHARRVQ
jgi:hypothetical protein